jgi:hypothetical protein
VFTDAMTWTDHKGRRMRLVMLMRFFVDDEQQFMDELLDKIESEFSKEPVDIYVNPTFLPEKIAAKYDELWTDKRIDGSLRFWRKTTLRSKSIRGTSSLQKKYFVKPKTPALSSPLGPIIRAPIWDNWIIRWR